MSTDLFKINTKWLKWARTSVKYEKDDVASKLNISPEKITEWEETGELTQSEIMALSEIYEVSPFTFFEGNDPVYDEGIPDFITVNSEKIKITPEIMFELRRAKGKRETLLNLEEEFDDFEFPLFSLNTIDSDNPLIIAENIRNLLKISKTDSNKKLDYWINLIESLGILVFEFYDIGPEELRGYALYYDKLPIIGINHNESINAKKFTLFHELIHLIMKKDDIINCKSQRKKDNKPKDSYKGVHNKAELALRKNGYYFTSLLIKAYEEELISDIDMALELEVSLEVMSKIIS